MHHAEPKTPLVQQQTKVMEDISQLQLFY